MMPLMNCTTLLYWFCQASQLEDLLRQRLGWDYRLQPLHDGADEDDDEYGPVVVELPEGLQLLAD